MATQIDELIVRIKADTKQLETSLDRIKKKVPEALPAGPAARFAGTLKRIGPIAGAAAVGLGAIATLKVARVGAEFEDLRLSLKAVFGGAQSASLAFGRIQKFAQTSPFQIQDLTSAFVQLKASGIEPTEKMLTTFSDAAAVTVNSLDTFQAMIRVTQRSAGGGLGLVELEQLQERGLPVFDILSERLGRSRLELSELGKTAEGASEIMNELMAGIDERFGGTTADRMKTFNQSLSTLEDNFAILADAIFKEGGLGGALQFVVDTLSDAISELGIFVKMASSGQSREFVTAKTLEEQLKIKQGERDFFLAGGETGFTGGIRKKDGTLTAFGEKGVAEFDAEIKKIQGLIKARDEELAQKERDRLATEAAAAAKKKEAEATDLAKKKVEESQKALEKLVDKTRTPLEDYTAEIMLLNAEIAKIGAGGESQFTIEQLAETMARLGEQFQPVKKKAEDVAATFGETMAPAIAQTVNAFTTDFVNALMEGASALDSFKNLAKNIVSQIISTFIQMAVINKILNAVFGNVSGYQMQPTIFNGKAGGGAVGANRPVLVGERGPELFIPHSAGSIKNAHNTRGMMGGGGVVVNQSINLSAGVQATVRSEVMQMLPMINDVTKAGVLEAASRGGKYRRGLLGG